MQRSRACCCTSESSAATFFCIRHNNSKKEKTRFLESRKNDWEHTAFFECDEELLKELGDGLYITELKGLHAGANAETGDFSIESAGFEVKNGEMAGAVRGFTLAGNFYQLLLSVEKIGSCVKMGMPGFHTLAAPEILVRGLSVAGGD